jgi:hypothetical protein
LTDEWKYQYACPDVHPATRKETIGIIPEKFEYPKVEEKVVYVEPKYKFEVPTTKGSEYLVSVCEEMRTGSVMRGEVVKGEGEKVGGKAAVKVEGEDKKDGGGKEGKKKNVGMERVYEWRDQVNDALQLGESIDEDRGGSGVKKQRMSSLTEDVSTVLTKGEAEKERKVKKDRERHYERKESRHKERRK